MRSHARIALAAFLMTCAVVVAQTPLRERLDALKKELSSTEPPPLADADLDVFEAAGIDPRELDVTVRSAMLACLRFASGVGHTDMPAIESFVGAEADSSFALALAVPLLLQGESDAAARLLVVGCGSKAADDRPRPLDLGRRITCFLTARSDGLEKYFELQFALLRCFEQGPQEQRRIIANAFGKPGMTLADTAAIRKELEQARKEAKAEQEDRRRAELAGPLVWVDDGGRLRQVASWRAELRPIIRTEIRLGSAAGGEVWGKLIGGRLSRGEDESGQLALVRQIGALAGDPLPDFDIGRGPILVRGAVEEAEALTARRAALSVGMSCALAATSIAAHTAELEVPVDPARTKRIADVSRQVLVAVRAAASRLHEIAGPSAEAAPVADDQLALDLLRSSDQQARLLLTEIRREADEAAHEATWRDMAYTTGNHLYETSGRSHVLTLTGAMRIVDLGTESRGGALTRSLRVVELRAFDVRDAAFAEVEPKEGGLALVVRFSLPVDQTVAALPDTGRPSVYVESVRDVRIACDSRAHRSELQAALQELKDRGGR